MINLDAFDLYHKGGKNCPPTRPYVRGFYEIERELIIRKHELSGITSYCEFGIGGGIKFYDMSRAFPDATIVGIDIVAEGQEYKRGMNISSSSTDSKVKFIYDTNSYSKEAPYITRQLTDIERFDIVLDDGDAGFNKDRQHIISVWKDSIKNDGLLISETIAGQSQEDVTPPYEYYKEIFDHHAKHDMIIFDMLPYAHNERLHEVMANGKTNSYLAVWMKNKTLYSDILEKYKHCIIAGTIE